MNKTRLKEVLVKGAKDRYAPKELKKKIFDSIERLTVAHALTELHFVAPSSAFKQEDEDKGNQFKNEQ